MKATVLLLSTLFVLWAFPTQAYTVKGNVECPDLLREHENAKFRMANEWWVLGYFTGRNYADDTSVGKGIESDVLYEYVYEYCRENLAHDIDDAALDLYQRLD